MSDKIPIPYRFVGSDKELSSSPDWVGANFNAAMSLNGSERDFEPRRRDNDPHSRSSNGNLTHPSISSPSLVEDSSPNFFQGILLTDPSMRRAVLDNIIDTLSRPENERLLRIHLPTIVHLAHEVPFDEIMSVFKEFLDNISKERPHLNIPKPPRGPSLFIPDSYHPPVNTKDEKLSMIFQDLFLQTGRVSHLNRVLALHPSYFERYYITFNKVMREPGPLPFHWRNYIAILAASRYNCQYLVKLQEYEFRMNNGDPKWLQGVEHIPRKIYNLLQVNALLAHQPWLLTKDHIEPLVRGADAWSIGELVHAFVLICTFTSLAGLVFGCGVTPEIDLVDFSTSDQFGESTQIEESPSSMIADTAKVMELLKKRIDNNLEDSNDKEQDFDNAGSETGPPITASESQPSSDLSRYIGPFTLFHTDFDVKSRNYSIFRVQEYDWKEHGYELVHRFYPDAAPLLDEEFKHIYTMTYNTFNNSTDIDTSPFRRAVWYYVQRVVGMCHDDYNYQDVNIFLNRAIKSYVKKVVCFPDTITRNDYVNLGYNLAPEEKVHIALLAAESHKQAALLHGLHAVMLYQNRFS